MLFEVVVVSGGGGASVPFPPRLLAQVPQLSTSPLPSQPTSWMTGSCCLLPGGCCWQLADAHHCYMETHTHQHSARWSRMSCSSASFIWSLMPGAVSGERRRYDCKVKSISTRPVALPRYDWR
jgi:hypothetical protein